MTEQALSDITVLDCSCGVAGSYCTKLLADFGANVIKVEAPKTGDITRRMPPFLGDDDHPEKSGLFFYLNTNKKSITLNLDDDRGAEIFKKLAATVDAVVESFSPGTMAGFGLSYETLMRTNSRLIMTSVSSFGQSGPYRDYLATNLTTYGLGGAMYTMRSSEEPTGRPVIEGGFQADYVTGVLSFIATMAALTSRADTGEGTWIDMSAMECVASTLMGHTAEYPYMGLVRRTNPFAIHGYPIGYSVPCKDGWISLTPGIGGAPNISLLIGRPELQDDPLFAKPGARMAEPEKFDGIVLPWLKEHGKWEITKEAQELRLAFTPVLSPGEVFKDEQIATREFFAEADHPVMGKVIYPGAPAKLSVTPWNAGRPPLLGESNEEVYQKLGYSRNDLVRLQEEGVI